MTDRLDAPPTGDHIRNPRLCALLRYWNAKRGDRPMPSRADIDPVEIPRLLPICLLADIDTPHPRIRLLGTHATNAYGTETRGRTIDRFDLGDFAPAWLEAFRIARESPVGAAGSFLTGTQFSLVETMLMPLADDGGRPRYIFGGLLISPSPRSMASTPQMFSCSVTPLAINTWQADADCQGACAC